MFRHFTSVWKPHEYHGPGTHDVFFEGWYYRFIDQSKQYSLIIIPGIYFNRKEGTEYGFIQIMDSATYHVTFLKYDIKDVHIARQPFGLKFGAGTFSMQHITLDVQTKEYNISGSVYFPDLYAWPVRIFSPGAMGWYAFMPFMQCYHGVLNP
jgi:hypothetical protein